MADVTPPDELIGLKREFLDLEDEVAEEARSYPSPMAMAGGEAELTPAQQQAWERLSARRTELAVRIHAHPAFHGLSGPERLAMDEAASKAAKAARAAT